MSPERGTFHLGSSVQLATLKTFSPFSSNFNMSIVIADSYLFNSEIHLEYIPLKNNSAYLRNLFRKVRLYRKNSQCNSHAFKSLKH